MANIVGGIATPHGSQVSVHWRKWHEYQEKDRSHPQLRVEPEVSYDALLAENSTRLASKVNAEHFQRAYEKTHEALAQLRDFLEDLSPDVILVVGDDQHEQLTDENLPMFCVYKGPTLQIIDRRPDGEWRVGQTDHPGAKERPAASQLGEHVSQFLAREEFDVAVSNRLKPGTGIGHAFTFIYKLWPHCMVPVLPVMVNTFYRPNQPSPG